MIKYATLATTVLTAGITAALSGELPLPPILSPKSAKDRPFVLMARMMDIFRGEYIQVLGMEGMQAQKSDRSEHEISQELTDPETCKKYCKTYHVNETKVDKILVTGNVNKQVISFVGPKDDTYATTVTQKYYTPSFMARPPERSNTGTLACTYFHTNKRVAFSYTEDHFLAAKGDIEPQNIIELKYDEGKQTISATAKATNWEKSLGIHPFRKIEELSRKLAKDVGNSR